MKPEPERNASGAAVRQWPEWLDLRTLKEYACVSERTLRDWIKAANNPCPASQRGGKLYVNRGEFDGWMRRQRVTPDLDVDQMVKDIVDSVRE